MSEALETSIFRRFGIQVKKDWLKSCEKWIEAQIEFCEQNFGRKLQKIKKDELIIDQLLNSDLKNSTYGVSILNKVPKNKPLDIKSPFILQIAEIIDISKSVYNQFTKLYDANSEKLDLNIESDSTLTQYSSGPTQNKSKRMLKMKLTDGQVVIDAAEIEIIDCLSDNLPIGYKILLQDSVDCFNNVLLLQPKNVICLGGSINGNIRNRIVALFVDILSSKDKKFKERFERGEFTKILHEELRNSQIDDERFKMILGKVSKISNATLDTSLVPESSLFPSTIISQNLALQNHDSFSLSKSQEFGKFDDKNKYQSEKLNIFEDEDDCILIDEDDEICRQSVSKHVASTSDADSNEDVNSQENPYINEGQNIEDFEILSMDENSREASKEPCKSTIVINENIDQMKNHLKIIEESVKLQKYLTRVKNCHITSVISNLSHNSGKKWSLKVKVEDSSKSIIECEISDELLTSFMEISASECESLKLKAKPGNNTYKYLVEKLTICKDKIKSLNGTCMLEICKTSENPQDIIYTIIEFEP
ncbi:MAG: recQ-mediated genome instability protein 1 [Marteilia pararefringens]